MSNCYVFLRRLQRRLAESQWPTGHLVNGVGSAASGLSFALGEFSEFERLQNVDRHNDRWGAMVMQPAKKPGEDGR